MCEKVIRMGECSVVGLCDLGSSLLCRGVFIVEDDNLVHAEYCQCPGDLAGQEGFLFVRFGIRDDAACQSDGKRIGAAAGWLEDCGRLRRVDYGFFLVMVQLSFLWLDLAVFVLSFLEELDVRTSEGLTVVCRGLKYLFLSHCSFTQRGL